MVVAPAAGVVNAWRRRVTAGTRVVALCARVCRGDALAIAHWGVEGEVAMASTARRGGVWEAWSDAPCAQQPMGPEMCMCGCGCEGATASSRGSCGMHCPGRVGACADRCVGERQGEGEGVGKMPDDTRPSSAF
eukprot:2074579-Prymnesium_polylepis.1